MKARTYNRIEKIPRELGFIIMRGGTPPLEKDYATVESILEKRRPNRCLSRSESVNMREDRDFSRMGIDAFEEGYVHQIEPLSAVEKRDVAWIGALQARYPKGNLKFTEKYRNLSDDQISDCYWDGTESENPSFEYATARAKVVSVEGNLSPVRPPQIEDALKRVAENGNNFSKS